MMTYYDDKDNAQKYIKIAAGYDGRELIEVLTQYLPQGSSVLELGMGPGVDLDLLSKHYQVTGSDSAQTFLDLYRAKYETPTCCCWTPGFWRQNVNSTAFTPTRC